MDSQENNREESIMVISKHDRRTRMLVYEMEKQRIQRKNLPASDYERELAALAERLKI